MNISSTSNLLSSTPTSNPSAERDASPTHSLHSPEDAAPRVLVNSPAKPDGNIWIVKLELWTRPFPISGLMIALSVQLKPCSVNKAVEGLLDGSTPNVQRRPFLYSLLKLHSFRFYMPLGHGFKC